MEKFSLLRIATCCYLLEYELYLTHIGRVLDENCFFFVEEVECRHCAQVIQQLALDMAPLVVAVYPLGRDVAKVLAPLAEILIGIDS